MSVAFLRAIAAGERPCPHKLAVKIDTFTGGEVSRRDLFPSDWQENWPELVEIYALADAALRPEPAAAPQAAQEPAHA